MKKKNDWKEMGQFLSLIVRLFGIIRGILKPMKIGIEIIPWLIEDGKSFFIDQCTLLGAEYLRRSLPGKPFMTVNLGQYSTIEALCSAIVANDKNYATRVFEKISFGAIGEDVELYEVTVAELGFGRATAIEIVWKQALDVGYILCPVEAMALAYIQCNDKKRRLPFTELISYRDGSIHIPCMYSDSRGTWLTTVYVGPGYLLYPDEVLVVALPRRK